MLSEQDFNKIFAANLNHYLTINDKTQADLAKYIGVSTASVSNWCKGIKLPRMDKVDKMCSFFNIQRNDLMLDNSGSVESLSPATASIVNLTPDQQELLADYELLNKEGQQEARKQVHNLTRLEEYTKAYEQDTAPSRLGA